MNNATNNDILIELALLHKEVLTLEQLILLLLKDNGHPEEFTYNLNNKITEEDKLLESLINAYSKE